MGNSLKYFRIVKRVNSPHVACTYYYLPERVQTLSTAQAKLRALIKTTRFEHGLHLTDYIAFEIQEGHREKHQGIVKTFWETREYRHSYTGISGLKILDLRKSDPPVWPVAESLHFEGFLDSSKSGHTHPKERR